MPTFLTTAKMDPALVARIEASVSGRRAKPGQGGASIAPRMVSIARFVFVLAVIAIVYLVVGLRRREHQDLETTRADLLAAVRKHAGPLTEADKTSA